MGKLPSYTAYSTFRRLTGVFLLSVYLVIAFSPMAPVALHSKKLAHALTGECSGDCSICGCSLESRSNKTCCCAKKIQMQQQQIHEDDGDTPECCRKKQASVTIIRCGCPCGDSKQLDIAGISSLEVIPFNFSSRIPAPVQDETHPSIPNHRLTSRYGDPPDQPPKIS